jgi:hypothetical protein
LLSEVHILTFPSAEAKEDCCRYCCNPEPARRFVRYYTIFDSQDI